MGSSIAFIGFGEAAQAFFEDWAATPSDACAYDRKTDLPQARAEKLADYERAGVQGQPTAAAALADARVVLSLVTADQALAAAVSAAPHLRLGALWFDLNSVAPDTKRAAAAVIEAAGARYVDVAVMSPVHPAKAGAPVLVSGAYAEAGVATLRVLGFRNVREVAGGVGAASSIKMIRSVLVKGLEALTAECALSAQAAGVLDEVLGSLNASWPGTDWAEKTDYNLDRMIVHGLRRAVEMEEAVKTVDALGVGGAVSRGTVERQREIGALADAPPKGLTEKLDLILRRRREAAGERKTSSG